MAEAVDGACQWRVRDLTGWRAGILFTASAELLVAWQAASVTVSARARPSTDRRFGEPVDRVQRARLGGNLDELEKGCRHLVEVARDGTRVPRPVRAVLADLERTLALAVDPAPCVLNCTSVRVRPPAAGAGPTTRARRTGV